MHDTSELIGSNFGSILRLQIHEIGHDRKHFRAIKLGLRRFGGELKHCLAEQLGRWLSSEERSTDGDNLRCLYDAENVSVLKNNFSPRSSMPA